MKKNIYRYIVKGQKVLMKRRRKQEEFLLNTSKTCLCDCVGCKRRELATCKRKCGGKDGVPLIKMDYVCECVAWFSSGANCMPSQTTAIKWALVNWQLEDKIPLPVF